MNNIVTNYFPKIIIVIVFFGLAMFVGREATADNWQMFGLLAVGLLLGLLISFFDRQWLSKYYRQDATTSKSSDHLSPALSSDKSKIQPYATRTTLFLLILVPFSLFIVTSTGSPLGVGLTIGLVVDVVFDMLRLMRRREEFIQTFLQQFQRSFSETEVLMIAGGSLVWLLLLFIFALS